MGLKISVEGAVKFTKLSVSLAYCWPPAKNSSKWGKEKFNALWCLSLLSAIGLFVPLLYSCYEYQADSLVITKSVCFLGPMAGFMIKIVICRIHRKRIQALISEMEEFLKIAKTHERAVLQRYVDRCSILHGTFTTMNYISTIFVISGPFLLPDGQRFPTAAVYPFSIDKGPMMYLIYAHQSFVGFQCSVGVTIDCQAALLMWYVGARLEILIGEVSRIKDATSLYDFIRKHQRLLRLAHEAKCTMSYIALSTTAMSGVGTICSCLQFVGVSLSIIFKEKATGKGTAAYSTPWIAMSPRMRRNVLLIIKRSQRPVIASIGGFLPALSLRYYGSFVSTAFSYITTLRIVVDNS